MQPAIIPPNEDERLAALYACGVLDTEPEAHFDDLVWLATYICDAPIAYISLVDRDRQWLKAKIGVTMCESGRAESFCSHTILSDDLFVVNDAQSDERFADNPLVTGPPYVRFYAGAPLRNSRGLALGSLCVIDHKPRTLNKEQLEALRLLGRQTSYKLDTALQINQMLMVCSDLKQVGAQKTSPAGA